MEKKDILILKKLNTLGMMLESLCQNQQSETLHLVESTPMNEDLFGTFHNKDDELSIFPASGELEVQQVELKLMDSRFFAKVVRNHTNFNLIRCPAIFEKEFKVYKT